MAASSWFSRLFGRSRKPQPQRSPRSRWAPTPLSLERLEDRLAPATLTEINGGTTLLITLDNTDELVGIASKGTTYELGANSSRGNFNFVNGGVTNAADFAGFGTSSLTMKASALARYNAVRFEDSATGTAVLFADSEANAYSDAFTVALDNGSYTVGFRGKSSFGGNALNVQADSIVFVDTDATVSTGNGGITLEGNLRSAPDLEVKNGVVILGTVTSTGTGNLAITGRAADQAGKNQLVGVVVKGGVISSTGTGTITVVGTGGAGTSQGVGVAVDGAGSLITSVTGAIRVTGTAGAGTENLAIGVTVAHGGKITSTGTGATAASITINGTGAAGTSNNNGVRIEGTDAAVASVDGKIAIVATPAPNSRAFEVREGGQISVTGSADVEVRATSGEIFIASAIVAPNATVRLTAEAGDITGFNFLIGGSAGSITAKNVGAFASGTVGLGIRNTVDGTFAARAGSGDVNFTSTVGFTVGTVSAGVSFPATAGISAGNSVNLRTFSGGITINQAVSAGTDGAIEVIAGQSLVVNANVTGGGGGVSLTGAGQEALNTAGAVIQNGAVVTATGVGEVEVNGRGGNGPGGSHYGVSVIGGGKITSGGGDVNVSGQGGDGSGGLNHGVFVSGGTITAGGTGQVVVIASAGTGGTNPNYGVYVVGSTSAITSAGGQVGVQAFATSGSAATRLDDGGSISSGNNATVQIAGDSLQFGGTTPGTISAGTGSVFIGPASPTTLVDLGGNDVLSGSPLVLGLSLADLGQITAGTLLVFGRSDVKVTTAIDVSARFGTLALVALSSIIDANASGTDLTVDTLILIGATGIGSGNPLETEVSRLTANNTTSGTIEVSNTGALTIAAPDASLGGGDTGITNPGDVIITTTGDLTIGASVSGSDVTLTSTAGGIAAGSITATGTASLRAAGAITDANGDEVNVTATALALQAATGIGSGDALEVAVDTVAASNGTSGGVALTDDDGFTVGTVGALSGVTANGQAITLTAGVGAITVDKAISATGGAGGQVRIETARNIEVTAAGSITTGDGGITLLANQQATPTAGNFSGVSVSGTVQSTSGSITMLGRGGDDAATNLHVGVLVAFGGRVQTTTGDITLTGTGGTGSERNYGVDVEGAGSLVTTADGTIRINGTGGTGTGRFQQGVQVLQGGRVSATGSGSITLTGQGGTGTDSNVGVLIASPDPAVLTSVDAANGNIQITATAGPASLAVFVASSGQVKTTGAGAIAISADSVGLASTPLVSSVLDSGGNAVAIAPRTAGRDINLGGDDTTASLALSQAELSSIRAGSLRIGDAAASAITVTRAIDLSGGATPIPTLVLQTGANIIDGNATGTDLSVANLALIATSGIGSGNALETAVSTLAASNAGTFSNVAVSNTGALTVGTVAGVVGVNNTVGSVNLTTTEALAIDAPVNGQQTVTLNAGGAVTQSAAGAITAASLELLGTGPFTLENAGNDVTTLAANTTEAISFRDANGIVVGLAGGTTGITTTDDDVTLCAVSGNVTISEDIAVGTGTVRLQSLGGVVTGGGAITAQALGVRSLGLGAGIALTADNNDVATLAAETTGAFTYASANGFSFGTVTASGPFTPGITGLTVGGDVEICVNAGDLNVATPINATGFSVMLHAAAGNVTQSAAGLITSTNLGTSASGAVILDLANVVNGTFAASATAGDVTFSSTTAFSVGSIGAGLCFPATTGVTAGQAVDLRTVDGDLSVFANVGAGTSVSLTAGGAGENFLTNGAAVTGTSATLTGNRMILGGGSVNVSAGVATILPFSAGRPIRLGTGVGQNGTLTIADNELDTITAGTLIIGNAVSGDISLIGPVSPANAPILQLNTPGAISGPGLITVATVDLNAGTGIGTGEGLELAASTISADSTTGNVIIDNALATAVTVTSLTTGTGAVVFDQEGGGSVNFLNAATTDGPVLLSNTGGDVTLTSVTANGAGQDVTVATFTSGDITVGTVTAADDVTMAAAGSILDDGDNATVIKGDRVELNAGVDIGRPGATGQIDTDANTWALGTVGGSGTHGIWAADTDAVTVEKATTLDGVIILSSAGTMTVTAVSAEGANRTAVLSTTVGDILVDTLAATGAARLSAAGAIVDSNGAAANVTAAGLALHATGGIGSGDALETAVSTLAASNTTSGNIEVINTGNLTIASVGPVLGVLVTGITNSGGQVAVSTTGDLSVDQPVTASGIAELTGGAGNGGSTITLNAPITGAGVFVNGGEGADLVTVRLTGAPTTLRARGGNDVITVAAAAGPLGAALVGTLTIDAGTGSNSLLVSEATSAVAGYVFVSAPSIASLAGGGFRVDYAATGGSFAQVTYTGGQAADTIIYVGKRPGAMALNGGGGNDAFIMQLNSAFAPDGLVVDGGAGANTMTMQDVSGGAVIRNRPTGPGAGTILVRYGLGPISSFAYQNIQQVLGINEAANYVQALFHNALGRNASAQDVAFYTNMLNQQGRLAVARAITMSPEGRAYLVREWYMIFAGRAPSAAESAPLVQALLAGLSEESVLGRLLGAAATRGTAVRSTLISYYYSAYLLRAASPLEVTWWVRSANTIGGARLLFLVSDEFYANGM